MARRARRDQGWHRGDGAGEFWQVTRMLFMPRVAEDLGGGIGEFAEAPARMNCAKTWENSEQLRGKPATLSVYNRALSPEEVKTLYDCEKP